MGRGLPCEANVDAAFVLRSPSRTIALCIERRIAEGIEPLQRHQTPGIAEQQTKRVDGGQMA